MCTLSYIVNNTDHHFSVILVKNHLDALFSMYLFLFSTCFEQPSVHNQENRILLLHRLVYITPYRYAGQEGTRSFLTGIPGSHLHRVIYTR